MSKRESSVADKTSNGIVKGFMEVEGERVATETFEVGGEKLTVRELLTYEGDEAYDAAMDDKGKFNTRLNTRMSLAKALVEPRKTIDDVGKMGTQKFLTALQSFNRLNSIEAGNPTPPAGSAGPTSPSTGESSPAT